MYIKNHIILFCVVLLTQVSAQDSTFKWKDYTNNATVDYKDDIIHLEAEITTKLPISNKKEIQLINNGVILKSGNLMEHKLIKDTVLTDVYHLSATLVLRNKGLNKFRLRIKIPGQTPVVSEPILINYFPPVKRLHILTIGAKSNLKYSVKDAKDVAKVFSDKQADLLQKEFYEETIVSTLLGTDATKSNIVNAIEQLYDDYENDMIGSDDLILVFISSHGALDENKDLILQPSDYDPYQQVTTSVHFQDDIVKVLKDIPCRKVVFIDACQSAGSKSNPADVSAAMRGVVEDELRKEEIMVIVSSRGDEYSYENVRWENGAFTEVLINGLVLGKADSNGDNNYVVTVKELYTYLSKEVPQLVNKHLNQETSQRPSLINEDKIKTDVVLYVVQR